MACPSQALDVDPHSAAPLQRHTDKRLTRTHAAPERVCAGTGVKVTQARSFLSLADVAPVCNLLSRCWMQGYVGECPRPGLSRGRYSLTGWARFSNGKATFTFPGATSIPFPGCS